MAGKRYSRQRELIYQAVLGSKEHPTAEMVYQWLKPVAPNLSLGTVYRNLTLLAEEGVLIRMPFPVERYDADLSAHPHFRCKGCGRVIDLSLPYDEELNAAAGAAAPQLRIEGHTTLFTGLCSDCQKAGEKEAEEYS